mmetsp:Transcript_7149/g.7010  ORF Transcript_7149/g.7010 Transcript_7149/m.7010 type:complete len:80 (+) Transcript_7149:254-493(+)
MALFKEDTNSKENIKMIEMINFFNLFQMSAEWEKWILIPRFLFKYTNFPWLLVIVIAIYYTPRIMECSSEISSTLCKES